MPLAKFDFLNTALNPFILMFVAIITGLLFGKISLESSASAAPAHCFQDWLSDGRPIESRRKYTPVRTEPPPE